MSVTSCKCPICHSDVLVCDHLRAIPEDGLLGGGVRRRLTVETSEDYLYDPERVQQLYEQLAPDPEMYGDEPAYAVFAYLHDSMFGANVFESQGNGGMWPAKDEEYDPDA